MKKTLWCALILLTISALPALAADDAVISVEALGMAAVTGTDLARAEDEAVADAKRNAVEQAVGVFVKSEVLGVNYQIVKNEILTRSQGYITWWQKVEGSRKIEQEGDDRLLSIKVRAKVSLVSLIDDMSDIEQVYNSIQRPRVMVLIDEVNIGKRGTEMPASASAVIRSLQDRGFDVVDESVLERIRSKETSRQIVERGDVRAASALALDEGAEILVIGKAKSYKGELPYNLAKEASSASARLDARIVYADTGQILFTPKPAEGAGVDFNSLDKAGLNALDAAGGRLISADADRFAAQVLAKWALEVQNGRVLRVIATGVSYEELTALKKAVKAFRGTVEIVRESYQSKTATLDVRTTLPADQFRERLMEVKIGRTKVTIDRTFGTVTNVILK